MNKFENLDNYFNRGEILGQNSFFFNQSDNLFLTIGSDNTIKIINTENDEYQDVLNFKKFSSRRFNLSKDDKYLIFNEYFTKPIILNLKENNEVEIFPNEENLERLRWTKSEFYNNSNLILFSGHNLDNYEGFFRLYNIESQEIISQKLGIGFNIRSFDINNTYTKLITLITNQNREELIIFSLPGFEIIDKFNVANEPWEGDYYSGVCFFNSKNDNEIYFREPWSYTLKIYDQKEKKVIESFINEDIQFKLSPDKTILITSSFEPEMLENTYEDFDSEEIVCLDKDCRYEYVICNWDIETKTLLNHKKLWLRLPLSSINLNNKNSKFLLSLDVFDYRFTECKSTFIFDNNFEKCFKVY